MVPNKDQPQPLKPDGIKPAQKIIGALIFYSPAVDSMVLVALGILGAKKAKGTYETMKLVNQVLDYWATCPNAKLHFSSSDIILKIHSDASHLSGLKACIISGEYFYMGNKNRDTSHPNEAVIVSSIIKKNVMEAASEAECGALYYNSKIGIPFRTALEEINWTQGITQITTYNPTVDDIIMNRIKNDHTP